MNREAVNALLRLVRQFVGVQRVRGHLVARDVHIVWEALDPQCRCHIGVQECPTHPGRLLDKEGKIAFRKNWDARVETGGQP